MPNWLSPLFGDRESPAGSPTPPLRTAIMVAWWGGAALVLVAIVQGPVVGAFSGPDAPSGPLQVTLTALRLLILVVVVALLAWYVGLALRDAMTTDWGAWSPVPPVTSPPSAGEERRFPQPPTVVVAVWLVVSALLLVAALVQFLSPGAFVRTHLPGLVCDDGTACSQVHDVTLMMLSAGIGSMITTILGYLKHAAELSNFRVEFVPWYFARPVLGMLVGAVFYFVLRGGLLATVGVEGASSLSPAALAAWGALVGLFSKNAVEKLREVFHTLFQPVTERSAQASGSEGQGTESPATTSPSEGTSP